MPPLPPMGRADSAGSEKLTLSPISPIYDVFPEIGYALGDPPPVNDWLDDSKDRIHIILEISRLPPDVLPPDVDKKVQVDDLATKTEGPKIDATRVQGIDTEDAQLQRDEGLLPRPSEVDKKVDNFDERSHRSSNARSSHVTSSYESSTERRKTSTSSGKKSLSSEYPGYVDLNSCRLGDAIDALISVPIIALQVIWISMEDQETTEANILYWTAAGMEIYLLLELWGYVLIGEVTPMSLLSIFLIRKARSRFRLTFMPFPDVIRRISRFLLGLSLIANTILSFWPGVNDLIPLALSIQLLLALLFSAGLNQ